jgi:hypothetical protein
VTKVAKKILDSRTFSILGTLGIHHFSHYISTFPYSIIPKELSCQAQKIRRGNQAGVLKKSCSGTFGSWLHAFPR